MQERENFAIVIYDGILLSKKKRIKQFGFFFEICNKSIFIKNWWNIEYFFNYSGKTLVMTNMFWDFRMIPLIFWINNNKISP